MSIFFCEFWKSLKRRPFVCSLSIGEAWNSPNMPTYYTPNDFNLLNAENFRLKESADSINFHHVCVELQKQMFSLIFPRVGVWREIFFYYRDLNSPQTPRSWNCPHHILSGVCRKGAARKVYLRERLQLGIFKFEHLRSLIKFLFIYYSINLSSN